jgi:hypothetical protein
MMPRHEDGRSYIPKGLTEINQRFGLKLPEGSSSLHKLIQSIVIG